MLRFSRLFMQKTLILNSGRIFHNQHSAPLENLSQRVSELSFSEVSPCWRAGRYCTVAYPGFSGICQFRAERSGMTGTAKSLSFVRSLLRDFGARRGFGYSLPLERIVVADGDLQQRALRIRWFASDAGREPDVPSVETEEPENKNEMNRWWQAFSEQTRTQSGPGRNSVDGNETPRWPSLKGERSRPKERSFLGGEGGESRWLFPDRPKSSGQGQQESLNKDSISRWFQAKDIKDSSTDGDREEISNNEVGARWLKSSQEKSVPEQRLANNSTPSSSDISWLGLNKDTSTSDRERLEASMQRLALMSKLGDSNQASTFSFLPPKDHLLRKYFDWENLASLEKRKKTLTKVRREFQIHKTDCGSSQVQIAQLTTKIKYMTKHMETHRKDYHSRKGLEAMVQQRRKILRYLRRKDWDTYCDVIAKLGLRDNVIETSRR